MKNMKKKIIITIVIIAVLAGAGYGAWQNPGVRTWVTERLPKAPDTEKLYVQALHDALQYKSQGDAGDSKAYQKAIDEYKKARRYNDTWLPYLNMGNAYRLMKDTKNAEWAYTEGMRKAPGEASLYLQIIEMYRYEMDKPEEVIVKSYEKALTNVPGNPDLRSSFGSYLRDRGRISDAINQFEMLVKDYPENESYTQELQSLKGRERSL